MPNELYATYFVNSNGDELANSPGILPISLHVGMKISIHGQATLFQVVEWSFRVGHPDEKAGLTVTLQSL